MILFLIGGISGILFGLIIFTVSSLIKGYKEFINICEEESNDINGY